MPRLKLFLLQTRLFLLFAPFLNLLSKIVWFLRLAQWTDKNKDVLFNDFPSKPDYYKRYKLYEYLLKNYIGTGAVSYFEFGVGDGETCAWWVKQLLHPDSAFYGFDTFEGLPEDWGIHKKGSFSMEGNLPSIQDDRVRLYKGLFQDTLTPFLTTYQDSRQKVIVMDADLYSATLYVLTTMAPYLKEGDIIVFDEFFEPQHEFMAYYNFLQAYSSVRMKLIGAANNYTFTAFLIS